MPAPRSASHVASAFIGGCVAGFAVSWNLTNTGAIATELASHYATGLVVVGLLTSIAFVAEFLVMIPGGRAIDRWGARHVALASIALCALGNALLLVIPGIGPAMVLRWLIGFGVGAGFVAGSVWIASDPRGRTPLGQGLYGGIALAGAGVATGVVPLLEGVLDWRSSYLTGLAISIVALAVAAACAGGHGHGERRASTPLRTLVADRTIARLGALHTASFAFSVIAGNWIVTLLTRHTGLSVGAAGAVGALTLLLGVAGRPLGGWAARRYPDRAYELLVGSLLAVAASVAVLGLSESVVLSALAAAALGLASGVPFGAVVDAAATAFPRAPGEAIGAFNLYAVTAVIAGTPLVGLTFSLSGEGRIGFVALAVLAVLAIAAIPRGLWGRAAPA